MQKNILFEKYLHIWINDCKFAADLINYDNYGSTN